MSEFCSGDVCKIDRYLLGGHSTTTWTKFWPILTTLPPPSPQVDKQGHFIIYPLSSNPQWHFCWPLLPPPSSCPRSYWMPPWQAGRQAASFWTAQGTKINDFFRKRLHARLLWGYVQFKRYNTAPLYLARLTYAGFVLCHFGCRIYVWRVTISSKERYYSLTKVYGWWWWRANSRDSFELSSWLDSA